MLDGLQQKGKGGLAEMEGAVCADVEGGMEGFFGEIEEGGPEEGAACVEDGGPCGC